MSGRGAAAGKAFLDGVLNKITDPGLREAASRAFADATVQLEVGNGVAGQSEIDRQLQELRTQTAALDTRQAELEAENNRLVGWHGELTTWHNANKAALDEYGKLKKAGTTVTTPTGTPTTGAPAAIPPGVLTEEAFKDAAGNIQASFLGFQRDQNQITREHFAKFGEIVELEPLLRHPQIAQLGLLGVYETVHKERLDKWKTDTTAAEKKKIGEEAVRAFQESQANMPYPTPTGAGSGSPLDALQVNKADGVVDAATAHYQRLQAERAAAAPR